MPAAVGLVLAANLPARAAYFASAEGSHVAVATDQAFATEAALESLRGGGNAVDAAISAAAVLGVVNPAASGLGGGGFALVYDARERRVVSLDFRETAPAHLDAAALVARVSRAPVSGAPDAERDARRAITVGVPGEPAGLEWLARRYGRRSLAADVAPAAALAKRGVPLGRHMADTIERMGDRLRAAPELAKMLLPGDKPLAHKAVLARADLSRTLVRFGAEGARPFYAGDIAAKIVSTVRAAGGTMDAADLAGYSPRERAPLTRTLDENTIVTMPAPSAGGLMLLEVLSMFGASPASELRAAGFNSSLYLHTLAEAMRGSIADRARSAGDPDLDATVDEAYRRALNPAQLAARKARINPHTTHPATEFRSREQGTSHLIVADAEGNVVTLTTTVNGPFGARLVAGDTGIVLNNELDDFSSPHDLAGFGIIGLGPNRPRPRARPVSSMAPSIVMRSGAPVLAVGGSGGMRIATGVTQATLARLVFAMDPGECVSAPRIGLSGLQDLSVDPDIASDVRDALRARGERVKDETYGHSAVQMVAWERTAGGVRLLAASDPRKGGVAAAQ